MLISSIIAPGLEFRVKTNLNQWHFERITGRAFGFMQIAYHRYRVDCINFFLPFFCKIVLSVLVD